MTTVCNNCEARDNHHTEYECDACHTTSREYLAGSVQLSTMRETGYLFHLCADCLNAAKQAIAKTLSVKMDDVL